MNTILNKSSLFKLTPTVIKQFKLNPKICESLGDCLSSVTVPMLPELQKVANKFTMREVYILYKLTEDVSVSYATIGKELAVSHTRIRQILSRMMRALRHAICCSIYFDNYKLVNIITREEQCDVSIAYASAFLQVSESAVRMMLMRDSHWVLNRTAREGINQIPNVNGWTLTENDDNLKGTLGAIALAKESKGLDVLNILMEGNIDIDLYNRGSIVGFIGRDTFDVVDVPMVDGENKEFTLRAISRPRTGDVLTSPSYTSIDFINKAVAITNLLITKKRCYFDFKQVRSICETSPDITMKELCDLLFIDSYVSEKGSEVYREEALLRMTVFELYTRATTSI